MMQKHTGALVRLYVILALSLTSGWAVAQEYVPGEVIVKVKNQGQDGSSGFVFLGKAVSQKQMKLKSSWNKMGIYHFALKPGQSVDNAIADLKNDPDVEYVEPNYILKKATNIVHDEVETFADIQALSQTGPVNTTDADIGVQQVREKVSSLSTEVVVAVIDTGLDLTHRVFTESQAIWTNTDEVPNNGIDDDNNGYVDDVNGWNFVTGNGNLYDDDNHGTHVSGIIISVVTDIFANPVANSPIKIMPLKFLDGNGLGATSDAIQAIYYAVQNGAKIINNSWGGSGYSVALHEAVAYTYENGVSFIAAAGNAGANNDSNPMYPANYDVPNVVSVAATTSSDYLASFSNYGFNSVDIGSPGVYIRSTISGGNFGFMSGTSMAAPFVSGVAAAMKLEQPSMLGYQVKSIIEGQTDYSSYLAGKVTTEGRINATNSVAAATGSAVTAQPGYTVDGGVRGLASDEAQMGGCGSVAKMYGDYSRNSKNNGNPLGAVGVVLLILVPFMYALKVRMSRVPSRRQHERFQINSSVTLELGEKQLVGNVSSISLGGVQVNTEALLEQGGIVTMKIASPDGKDLIEVQGQIVWSEKDSAYGVKFENANSSVLNTISNWTRKLVKEGV